MEFTEKDLKCLDDKSYKKIVIIEEDVNKSYRVDITEKDERVPKQIPIGLNKPSEKIKQIIYYFLNNNTITSISKHQIIDDYGRLFDVISSEEALLALRLFCDKKILSDCADKYIMDRKQFLDDRKDVIKYDVNLSNYSSNYKEKNLKTNEEKVIQLSLITKDGNIWDKDKKFFENWILEKLHEQGSVAKYIDLLEYSQEQKGYVFDIPRLICGNVTIYLNDKLLQGLAKKIVREYNNLLEPEKILKLQMEGFKWKI